MPSASVKEAPAEGEARAPGSVKFGRGRATLDLAVGDVVAGKFKVERIIGEGAMGLVVAATHLGLDEHVALKFLHPDACTNPEYVARFFQEAKAAAKLKSEYVAHVLDVGQLDNGTPFIVMEYLRGGDLRQVLQAQGRLPVETAVEYIIQACEGLAEAHARGIIHRDIKPENLYLVERSQEWNIVKILDFGISKATLESALVGDSNIRTGSIMGSPCYMSPEQLRETATVDPRTDVWSLGTVLYELLTGMSAFDSSLSLTALICQILNEPYTPLRLRRNDVPVALEKVVTKCLAKQRDERFPNAAELAIALLPFAPKRARTAAERALAVTREAGMSSYREVPASVAPGPPAPLAQTALALSASPGPLSSSNIVTTDSTLPPPPALVQHDTPPKRMRGVIAGSLVVLAIAILAGAWLVRPSPAVPVAAATPAAPPVPAPLPPASIPAQLPVAVSAPSLPTPSADPPPVSTHEPAPQASASTHRAQRAPERAKAQPARPAPSSDTLEIQTKR